MTNRRLLTVTVWERGGENDTVRFDAVVSFEEGLSELERWAALGCLNASAVVGLVKGARVVGAL